jgi:hypothetical protein
MPIVPNAARKLTTRVGATATALVVATAVTSPFDLGWRQLEILAFVGITVFAGELWWETTRRKEELEAAERREAEVRMELATERETSERVPDLEGQVAALEIECDDLRQKLQSPRISLEDIMSSIDGQISIIDLMKKHRTMEAEGSSQWVVTSIELHEDEVRIVAHTEADAERLQAELMTLVWANNGGFVANAQVAAASGHVITALTTFEQIPEWLQDALLENPQHRQSGLALRLFGLTVAPYTGLTAEQLDELREALRETNRKINELLNPAQQLLEGGPAE